VKYKIGPFSSPSTPRSRSISKVPKSLPTAASAKPEIYEALEERDVKYAIRIPANESLERDTAELVPRPAEGPSQRPSVEYKGFLYRAASWKTARLPLYDKQMTISRQPCDNRPVRVPHTYRWSTVFVLTDFVLRGENLQFSPY
jgi:hypothetical protein